MMEEVADLTVFDQDALKVELILDETNEEENPSLVAFEWRVYELSGKTMMIQIDFRSPPNISAGQNRDFIKVTVLDGSNLISERTGTTVPALTSSKMKAPKMVPNNDFTRSYVAMTDNLGTLTSASIVGNFMINIVLSSAMNLLWGLMHFMQIIAHLPLINVQSPANAEILFLVLVKISTFNIIPTDDLIENFESDTGLLIEDD